jgi:hypothetical protein
MPFRLNDVDGAIRKSVSPILDFRKLEYSDDLAINNVILQTRKRMNPRNQKRDGESTKVRFLWRCNFSISDYLIGLQLI